MSRHWKPDGKTVRVVPLRERGPWGSVDAYLPRRRRSGRGGIGALFAGAILAGVVAAFAWQVWESEPVAIDTSAIEWNAVQAVPTRELSPDEVEWEKRGQEWAPDEAQDTNEPARAVRASFGYCHTGGGTNCVVDGDTFYISGEKVRIAGIDAPETHPPRCADEARLGNAATEKLNALLNSGAVTMTSIDRDRDTYGRLLRNVAVDGEDVGEAMISAGVAREYGSGRRPWC